MKIPLRISLFTAFDRSSSISLNRQNYKLLLTYPLEPNINKPAIACANFRIVSYIFYVSVTVSSSAQLKRGDEVQTFGTLFGSRIKSRCEARQDVPTF